MQRALQRHLQEARGHLAQIKRVFAALDETPIAKKCPAMAGLIEEALAIVRQNKKSPLINAAIISAAQKIEYYEIASYGILHLWAGMLESEQASNILQQILDEEKETDHILNHLALSI